MQSIHERGSNNMMNKGSIEEIIKNLEVQMWEAFSCGNSKLFSEVVSNEAMMICGGYRETGYEYANIVAQIRLDGYEIKDFVVKIINPDSVLTNYVINVECPDPSISGVFRVSSLWIKNEDKWELVFNQDTKLP